jgi:hypothetical protein
VVAHLDFDTAQVRQRMSYDPWGTMKVLRRADFDGDGEVTLADYIAFDAAYQNLEPAADFRAPNQMSSGVACGRSGHKRA